VMGYGTNDPKRQKAESTHWAWFQLRKGRLCELTPSSWTV
jgi:hypothetical protein